MKRDHEHTEQPQDVILEATVLGDILVDKEAQFIVETMNVDVFYTLPHQLVFKAIKALVKQKEPVDILTVTNQVKRDGNLETVGGAYFISNLTSRYTGASNIDYYSKLLLQFYFRRQLIEIAVRLQTQAYDNYLDVFEIMDGTVKKIRDIDANLIPTGFTPNAKIIDDVLVLVKQSKTNGGIIGASSGMKNLDFALMGLRKQLKYVIAARPGMGKTSIAKTICINLAHLQKMPGVFFSMEMPKEQLMMACISELLQIPNQILQKGEINHLDEKRILDLKKTFFEKNFIIIDDPNLDPFEIRRRLIKLKETHNIEWFALDYLGLMRLKGNEYKGYSKEARVSEIAQQNKNTTKELNLICLELSQLNRDVERRSDFRPKLSDLRDSGEVEASADVVLFPYRPEYHGIKELSPGISSAGFAEVIIAKNRFGPLKSIAGIYKPEFTQFIDHTEVVELDIVVGEDEVSF